MELIDNFEITKLGKDNNDSGIIDSNSTHQGEILEGQLNFYFGGIGVTLVSPLGLSLNLLSIIVFLKPRMRSFSISVLLIGLQVSDILVGFALLWSYILQNIHGKYGMQFYRSMENYGLTYTYYYIGALLVTGLVGSRYFTILVSLERYIAVCHPLHLRECTSTKVIICSIIGATFSILYSIPYWLASDILSSPGWLYAQIVIFHFIPFLVLLLLNIVIYSGYRKAQKRLRSLGSTNTSREDNSVTQLLIAIVIVFLTCNSFYVMYTVFQILQDTTYHYLFGIVDLLIVVNSSCNFIFFCAFGTRFRSELHTLLVLILPFGRKLILDKEGTSQSCSLENNVSQQTGV